MSQHDLPPAIETIVGKLQRGIPHFNVWHWLLDLEQTLRYPNHRVRVWVMGCVNTMCQYDQHGVFGIGGELPPAQPNPNDLGLPSKMIPFRTFLGNFDRQFPNTKLQQDNLDYYLNVLEERGYLKTCKENAGRYAVCDVSRRAGADWPTDSWQPIKFLL